MTFDLQTHIMDTAISKIRYEKMQHLLNELDLRASIHLMQIMESNSFQSYHNYQHMISVALLCYDAANFYSLTGHEVKLLVLAALYHDLGHSGNKVTADIQNVSQSLVNADRVLRIVEPELSEADLRVISRLILVTENSGLVVAGTLLEKVLSDADLLQSVELDGKLWLTGLNDELGIEVTATSTKAFIEGKIKTKWGLEKINNFDYTLLD